MLCISKMERDRETEEGNGCVVDVVKAVEINVANNSI